MNTQSSQPRAIYYVVALQIWEYFSFYGMRALLILYLTNQLKYDDNHAYALFSAYCSLVYVTPILGGFLADKLLGNRMAVMLGALLMAIGHLVLGASEIAPTFLYLSLAIIVCGYGLFKSNNRLRLRAGGVQLGDGLRAGGRRHDRRASDFPQRQSPFPPHPGRQSRSAAGAEFRLTKLGLAAGAADRRAAADHRAVLAGVVGLRADCGDGYRPGGTNADLPAGGDRQAA